jgi:hypothetical protein
VSGIYDNFRQKLLTASFDWRSEDYLLTAWSGLPDFVPADASLTDILTRANATLQAMSLPILGKAVSFDGTAQTGPVVIQGIPATEVVSFFVMSADPSDEPLLFIDDAEGLPWTSNGLDLVVQPDWLYERGWFRP